MGPEAAHAEGVWIEPQDGELSGGRDGTGWTVLSSHGLVLLAITRHPAATMREIASQVGITERAVQRLVRDLVVAGYVERFRDGRNNTYCVHLERNLPHPTTCQYEVNDLFALLRIPRR